MAHVGAPGAAARGAAAAAAPVVSTGANIMFGIATAISVLYTGLVTVVLLFSKPLGASWTGWLNDRWGRIALGYVVIQQLQHFFGPVARWQKGVNRGTEFLPLLPLVIGALSPAITWGWWESNIAWTVGLAVIACVIGSFTDWRR